MQNKNLSQLLDENLKLDEEWGLGLTLGALASLFAFMLGQYWTSISYGKSFKQAVIDALTFARARHASKNAKINELIEKWLTEPEQAKMIVARLLDFQDVKNAVKKLSKSRRQNRIDISGELGRVLLYRLERHKDLPRMINQMLAHIRKERKEK